MSASSDSTTSDTVHVGKGEFQIKDIHVSAEVKVLLGTIREINFASLNKEKLEEADEIKEQLIGQPLSKALEVKAREVDPPGDRPPENPSKVALLEAFHRAVESCIDVE